MIKIYQGLIICGLFVLCCCDENDENSLSPNKSSWEFADGVIGSPFCGLVVEDDSPAQPPPRTLSGELFGVNDPEFQRTVLNICSENFKIKKDQIVAAGHIEITKDEIVMSTKGESLVLNIVHHSSDTLILHTDAVYDWGTNITFVFVKVN